MKRKALVLFAVLLLFTACRSPQISQGDTSVTITADKATQQINIPSGSTVQDALNAAGLTMGSLDRVDPPAYTILSGGAVVTVTRVTEKFETQQVVIPFEHQELRNESLPAGETRLIQAGQNGIQEITIRHVSEDDVEVSNSVISETILQPPTPEIVMVGVQTPFAPLSIPGKLAYLAGGNAWVMENSTANRRPIITTGDLDGRIFALSPDGYWLLFSRTSTKTADEEKNTLWVVSTTNQTPTPINLHVSNVVHFGDWVPGQTYTIAYSTVEPRPTAPGWQANNNLYFLPFSNGGSGNARRILDANSGGVYGWWGTNYIFSPDGSKLVYARPDGIGVVDIEKGTLNPLLDITPLNTHSTWAWIPGLTWGADSRSLYVVTHAPPTGLVDPADSPYFDLSAVSLVNSTNVRLVQQTGMFAYPAASPLLSNGTEESYRIAFLQAIFPAQSLTSRYRLVVLDSDGSNQQTLFPGEGLTSLDPQTPVWAPAPLPSGGDFLAVFYQGNLWLIDTITGQAYQVTGDGLIEKIDWK